MSIGISKRALFEDYYMDEIGEVIHEYNELHRADKKEESVKEVYADEFF